MIKDLIDGISVKLNSVFGDDYTIYADNAVTQGLEEPCFFISILQPSQTQILKGRYFRTHPFVIQYFPKNEGNYFEMYSVGSKLMDEMEYITLLNNDLIRGTDMSYEIVDGILHFKVNYNMFVCKPNDITPMENVKTKIYKGR